MAWTLEMARDLIREIRPSVRGVGFDIGITGSVLTAGQSQKDLDLIVYPLCKGGRHDIEGLEKALDVWLKLVRDADEIHAYWRAKGSSDQKIVQAYGVRKSPHHNIPSGRRVDVFFMDLT